jgi:hypothetical protein
MGSLGIFLAYASGGLNWLLKALSEVAKWLLADWRNFAVALLGALYLFANFVHLPRLRADLAASEELVEATQLAHLGTITNFIDASDEAKRQAEANVARVEAEQEAITDATLADLRADHRVLRARFDRLRASAARTDPSRADAAGLPGAGNASGRAAAAPAHPDLRAPGGLTPQPLCPPALVCLTIDEAEQASEDAHNHNRLIDWLLAQSAVRFTPEGKR